MGHAQKAAQGQVRFFDDRLGASDFLRRQAKKVFPDHWSFLLGEIALYTFVILILTGIYLSFFYVPDATEITYHGPYEKLQGTEVSRAYASTVNINFEVRGGLLMRQMHHWAALLFVAAMALHMLRMFFTGAFRKPREINWMIGVLLFFLGTLEGFAGYSLPDDLLSGAGIRIADAALLLPIPWIGSYLSFMVFGGAFPGEHFFQRLYVVHILLIPGILLALIAAHLMILWHQKHTQFPGKGRAENNVVGQPFYPLFMAKTGSFFFYIFAVLAFLGTFAQINPIWLWGPYVASNVSNISHPDWYIGFLIGALRLMPGVWTQAFGHTVAWNVLVPGVIWPVILMTALLTYPFLERWATGDRRHHHLLDRPRHAPTRTGLGAAGVSVYGVMWAAGGSDLWAYWLHLSIQAVVWIQRCMLFILPVVAFLVVRRFCLGLQRRDRMTAEEGYETGIIYRDADGKYTEVHERVPDEEYASITSKPPVRRIKRPDPDDEGVAPDHGGFRGRLQATANHFYTNDDVNIEPEIHPGGRDEQAEREQLEPPSESE